MIYIVEEVVHHGMDWYYGKYLAKVSIRCRCKCMYFTCLSNVWISFRRPAPPTATPAALRNAATETTRRSARAWSSTWWLRRKKTHFRLVQIPIFDEFKLEINYLCAKLHFQQIDFTNKTWIFFTVRSPKSDLKCYGKVCISVLPVVLPCIIF